jgi:hypothetical protein
VTTTTGRCGARPPPHGGLPADGVGPTSRSI